jgi:hypothetical protein
MQHNILYFTLFLLFSSFYSSHASTWTPKTYAIRIKNTTAHISKSIGASITHFRQQYPKTTTLIINSIICIFPWLLLSFIPRSKNYLDQYPKTTLALIFVYKFCGILLSYRLLSTKNSMHSNQPTAINLGFEKNSLEHARQESLQLYSANNSIEKYIKEVGVIIPTKIEADEKFANKTVSLQPSSLVKIKSKENELSIFKKSIFSSIGTTNINFQDENKAIIKAPKNIINEMALIDKSDRLIIKKQDIVKEFDDTNCNIFINFDKQFADKIQLNLYGKGKFCFDQLITDHFELVTHGTVQVFVHGINRKNVVMAIGVTSKVTLQGTIDTLTIDSDSSNRCDKNQCAIKSPVSKS